MHRLSAFLRTAWEWVKTQIFFAFCYGVPAGAVWLGNHFFGLPGAFAVFVVCVILGYIYAPNGWG